MAVSLHQNGYVRFVLPAGWRQLRAIAHAVSMAAIVRSSVVSERACLSCSLFQDGGQ